MQQHRGGVRVALQQGFDGAIRVLQQSGVVEEGVDGAGVGHVETGLGALQHGREAIPPGDVQPRRVRPLGVSGAGCRRPGGSGAVPGTDG